MLEPMLICSARHGDRWAVQLFNVPRSDGYWEYELIENQIGHGETRRPYAMKGVALEAFHKMTKWLIDQDRQSGELSDSLAFAMLQGVDKAVETQGLRS